MGNTPQPSPLPEHLPFRSRSFSLGQLHQSREQPQPALMTRFEELKQGIDPSISNQKANERFMDRMDGLIRQGEFERAVPLLQNWISKMKQHLPDTKFVGAGNYRNWVGLCPQGARQWFFQATKIGYLSRNPYDYVCLCMGALGEQGNYFEEGVQWYKKVLKHDGNNFQLWMGLGNLYYNAHHLLEAQNCYMKARQLNPNHQKVHEYLAWIYGLGFDNDQMGCKCASRALQINQNNFYAHLILAMTDNSTSTLMKLKTVMQREPKYYFVHLMCAAYYPQSENILKYLKHCQEKNIPNDRYYLNTLIKVLFSKKKYSKAKQYFDKCVKLHPKFDQPYLSYATLLNGASKTDQAVSLLQKCIKINPRSFRIYQELGKIQAGRQNSAKAIKYYEKACEVNPYNYRCYMSLAALYEQKKQPIKENSCYLTAVKLKSNCFDALEKLMLLHMRVGQYKKSVEYGLRAEKQCPTRFTDQLSFYLALIFRNRLQDPQSAVKALDRCIKRKATHLQIYNLKAQILDETLGGRKKDAFICFMQAVQLLSGKPKKGALHDKLLGPMSREEAKYLVLECYLNNQKHSVIELLEYGFIFERLKDNIMARNAFLKAKQRVQQNPSAKKSDRNEVDEVFGSTTKAYQRKLRGKGCKMEEINHNNFLASAEFVFKQFYGYRRNDMTNQTPND